MMGARVITIALGVWLMVAPPILRYPRTGADTIDRIVGPVVVLVGVLALREVTRIARYALFLPALFLMLAPWFLHYPANVELANAELTAIALTICAAIPGRLRQRTGGGWLGLLNPALPGEQLREIVEGGPQ
jgi:hypothetical protein